MIKETLDEKKLPVKEYKKILLYVIGFVLFSELVLKTIALVLKKR
jgi:hypothetical protein